MDLVSFRGFVFDVDATLVNTTAVIDEVWKEWSYRKGLDFYTVHPHVHGRKINETLAAVDPKYNTESGVAEVKEIAVHKMETATPITGAVEFVSQIPNHMWAIATSGPRTVAETSLMASGFSLPPVMVCAEDVENGKPDPEPFVRAVRELRLLPEQVVAFEDSPAGVKSAKEAGCFTVALTTSHDDHDLLDADVIIEDFGDICATIKGERIHLGFLLETT